MFYVLRVVTKKSFFYVPGLKRCTCSGYPDRICLLYSSIKKHILSMFYVLCFTQDKNKNNPTNVESQKKQMGGLKKPRSPIESYRASDFGFEKPV